MPARRWKDVRPDIVARMDEREIESTAAHLLARVRAHQLSDMRKRQGITQRQVALAMGVSVGRVSQIEAGDLSGIDVLDRYISAIGGQLHLTATFGERQIRVG